MSNFAEKKLSASIKNLIEEVYTIPTKINVSPEKAEVIKVDDHVSILKWFAASDQLGHDEIWVAAYMLDGEIVSYATSNFATMFNQILGEVFTDLSLMDVWTNPEYTRKGYAKACVDALNEQLIQKELGGLQSDHLISIAHRVNDKKFGPFFKACGYTIRDYGDGISVSKSFDEYLIRR